VDFCNSDSYTKCMSNKTYIILGIKHSGKSTQSRFLADHLNCPLFDIDDLIEKNTGRTAREYYIEKGPVSFMAAEEACCGKIAQDYKDQQIVISTGGGICDNAPALNYLRPLGTFVFIQVSEETACNRILKKATQFSDGTWKGLPAYISKLKPKNEEKVREIFHDFYVERTEIYKTIADVIVPIKDASKEDNFKTLKSALGL